jgi:hypothetical protein
MQDTELLPALPVVKNVLASVLCYTRAGLRLCTATVWQKPEGGTVVVLVEYGALVCECV